MENYLKFKPVVSGSGFKMEGYHIWCSSVIYDNGIYYMFASRWLKNKTFPHGYMTDSEIVLAETDDLNKPFKFKKVIIGKREEKYWDSMMAHNPYIIKTDNKYVLYYIGTPDGKYETRAIGYAWADSIDGEWMRSEEPILLPKNANNPCVVKSDKGNFILYFRDGNLKVSVAISDRFNGKYTIINENIFKKGMIEDMFVYNDGGKYVMLAEDVEGAYTGLVKGGVKFTSRDGVVWNDENAVPAYDFDIIYDNGRTEKLQRRERPMILFVDNKKYFFSAAKINGENQLEGGDTWNLVQEFC